MKLLLSCWALRRSAPGRDFLSDRGVVDATTLARLMGEQKPLYARQPVLSNRLAMSQLKEFCGS